jgi:exopolysaccharide biosynthesis WecB/TagA/CpsF family protein
MNALLLPSPAIDKRRHDVMGVLVSAMDYTDACDAIAQAAQENRALTVTALAVHGVMTGVLNRSHRRRLNSLDLVLPDGQPVRWALNLLFGENLRDRVYGPNLMLRICARAEALGLSVGLYGNRADVLEDLASHLSSRFPHLNVVAVLPSLFRKVSPEEQAALADRIASTGADLLFVGLGCPRQEVWLYENRVRLNMPLIAVGAAFDFHAKRIPQAPLWMQDHGLEWLFRLSREPRRLWRRYVFLNPLFLVLLTLQYLGIRHTGKLEKYDAVRFEGYA